MKQEDIENAAGCLARAWQDGHHIDRLPEGCVPMDLDEGYALQAAMSEIIEAQQIGWKIAASNEAGQRHIDVSGPIIGRLFSDRVYPSPAHLFMRDNLMRVAEAEFTFRFGLALEPATNWTRESVMERVDALFPSIELPDSRFHDFIKAGAPGLVADNACGREYVLGNEVVGRWRQIAFDRYPVDVYLNGKLAVRGSGADVLGDPRDALTWLVNELGRQGVSISPGTLVTTGVVGKPVPIAPGDRVKADFGVLGEVEVSFNERLDCQDDAEDSG